MDAQKSLKIAQRRFQNGNYLLSLKKYGQARAEFEVALTLFEKNELLQGNRGGDEQHRDDAAEGRYRRPGQGLFRAVLRDQEDARDRDPGIHVQYTLQPAEHLRCHDARRVRELLPRDEGARRIAGRGVPGHRGTGKAGLRLHRRTARDRPEEEAGRVAGSQLAYGCAGAHRDLRAAVYRQGRVHGPWPGHQPAGAGQLTWTSGS